MMARPSPAARSPYSTAVAPVSSATKLRHALICVANEFHWCIMLSLNSVMPSQKRYEMRYQGQVCGRHLVVPQTVRPDPGKLLSLPRGHDAFPASAHIEGHEKMKVRISVAREGEWGDTAFLDRNSQFFLELSQDRLLRLLSCFHFATWELP